MGRMVAVALGMLALGLALLAGLQLTDPERRFRWSFAPALVGRLPWDGSSSGSERSDPLSRFAPGPWSGGPVRTGPPPPALSWLVGYMQGGWTRLRGPGRSPERRGPGSAPPFRGTWGTPGS